MEVYSEFGAQNFTQKNTRISELGFYGTEAPLRSYSSLWLRSRVKRRVSEIFAVPSAAVSCGAAKIPLSCRVTKETN